MTVSLLIYITNISSNWAMSQLGNNISITMLINNNSSCNNLQTTNKPSGISKGKIIHLISTSCWNLMKPKCCLVSSKSRQQKLVLITEHRGDWFITMFFVSILVTWHPRNSVHRGGWQCNRNLNPENAVAVFIYVFYWILNSGI